jgi:hypothetical protein
MITAHDLSAEMKLILSEIEENGGEVTPEIAERFNLVFAMRDTKLEALASMLKTADKEELILNAEIKRLQERRKEVERKVEHYEKMVREILPIGEIWNTGLHKICYKRCPPSVFVAEGAELDEVYYRTKIISEVDKAKLLIDLKGGATIEGAHLITDKFNLVIK